ncbi:MAG: type II secretion system secretin GspD [Syntrophobacterales bacterium]|nr:type II secretion system secretin GspD [Syntrophobacterales bacterium]
MDIHKILAGLLAASLVGCATPSPGPLLPPKPAVRVMQAPGMPPDKPPKPEAPEEKDLELVTDEGLKGLTTALKSLPTRRRTAPKGETLYPIELNLQNADLVEAVRALADTLGLNYSIDPKVKGTVNVRASGKLTRGELLSILETMLLVNGAALVQVGKSYNIVPLDKAAGEAAPVYARGLPAAGMTAQVVLLDAAPAKEMAAVLKPLLSAGGKIAEAPNNSLVIVDYPANLEKLVNLVNLVDKQGLAKTSVSVLRVKNTDPTQIIPELETIFGAYGALSPVKDKGRGGVQFLAMPRMNAVMILAPSPQLMQRAEYWVRQLDLKTDTLANIHVYNVENYRARNLADLLIQVYGGQVERAGVREIRPEPTPSWAVPPRPALGAGEGEGEGVPRTGGGLTSGLSSGMGATGTTGLGATGRAPGLGIGLGTGLAPAAPSPRERAAPLRGAAAAGELKEGVRIIPDEENNLLVIVAPPYEWKIIQSLLKRLDVQPRQAMCEVLIAEITLTDDLRYGVEWFINNRVASETPTIIQPSPIAGNPPIEILKGASAALQGIGGFTFAARDALNQFRLVINMLATKGLVQVLASPHIMAANNQEARIQIGQEVPILTSQSIPLVSQTQSLQTQTVSYRSTGIILLVRPQINAKGMITLDISQEVSAIDASAPATGVNSPTFLIRQARTSLITADNQTIILGGLIREDVTRGGRGVPGLRNMPLLGPLFGSETRGTGRTELILLITPHIIHSMEEGARITREVQDRIELKQLRGGTAPAPAPPAPAPAPAAPAAPPRMETY